MDFAFDPGTLDRLRDETRSTTRLYDLQGQTIERADRNAMRLDRSLERIGSRLRSLRGGHNGPGMGGFGSTRKLGGNLRDVAGLARGEVNLGNVIGTVELARDAAGAAGFRGAAGLGTSLLRAAPAIGAAIGIVGGVKATFAAWIESVEKGPREALAGARLNFRQILKDPVQAELLLDTFLRAQPSAGRADIAESAAERLRRTAAIGGRLGQMIEDPFIGAALLSSALSDPLKRGPGPAVGATRQNLIQKAQVWADDPAFIAAMASAGSGAEAFRERNELNKRWAADHGATMAEDRNRQRVLEASEKRERMATLDWNQE